MQINFNSIFSNTVSSFNERTILSPFQKKVVLATTIVFAAIAAIFFALRSGKLKKVECKQTETNQLTKQENKRDSRIVNHEVANKAEGQGKKEDNQSSPKANPSKSAPKRADSNEAEQNPSTPQKKRVDVREENQSNSVKNQANEEQLKKVDEEQPKIVEEQPKKIDEEQPKNIAEEQPKKIDEEQTTKDDKSHNDKGQQEVVIHQQIVDVVNEPEKSQKDQEKSVDASKEQQAVKPPVESESDEEEEGIEEEEEEEPKNEFEDDQLKKVYEEYNVKKAEVDHGESQKTLLGTKESVLKQLFDDLHIEELHNKRKALRDQLVTDVFKSIDLGTGDGTRRDYVYLNKLGLVISKDLDGSQNSQGQQPAVMNQPVDKSVSQGKRSWNTFTYEGGMKDNKLHGIGKLTTFGHVCVAEFSKNIMVKVLDPEEPSAKASANNQAGKKSGLNQAIKDLISAKTAELSKDGKKLKIDRDSKNPQTTVDNLETIMAPMAPNECGSIVTTSWSRHPQDYETTMIYGLKELSKRHPKIALETLSQKREALLSHLSLRNLVRFKNPNKLPADLTSDSVFQWEAGKGASQSYIIMPTQKVERAANWIDDELKKGKNAIEIKDKLKASILKDLKDKKALEGKKYGVMHGLFSIALSNEKIIKALGIVNKDDWIRAQTPKPLPEILAAFQTQNLEGAAAIMTLAALEAFQEKYGDDFSFLNMKEEMPLYHPISATSLNESAKISLTHGAAVEHFTRLEVVKEQTTKLYFEKYGKFLEKW